MIGMSSSLSFLQGRSTVGSFSVAVVLVFLVDVDVGVDVDSNDKDVVDR